MKTVIKLTSCGFDESGYVKNETILIGVESIIDVKKTNIGTYQHSNRVNCTAISSRHAMVTTNYVVESVDEIYDLINE